MNHKLYIPLFVTAAMLLSGTFTSTTYATTGGPTLVYDLRVDQTTKSIYYIQENFGGRGCPAELYALELATNTAKTIYGCDDETDNRDEKIATFTSTFPTLAGVNLRKNDFSITLEAVGEEKLEGTTEVFRTNFIAHLLQDKIEKAAIPFSGCNEEQPLVAEGYSIPEDPTTLVLLFSTKGDCIEGGYIRETVHIIKDANLTDSSPVFAFKSLTPLLPNEANLVVYLTDPEPVALPVSTEAKSKNTTALTVILTAAVSLLAGMIVGRLTKSTSVNNS